MGGDRKASFRFWPSRRPLPNGTQRRPLLKSAETPNSGELNVGTTSSSSLSSSSSAASSSGPLETENEKNESPPPDSGRVVPVDDASIVSVNQPSPLNSESERADGNEKKSDSSSKLNEESKEEERKINHTEAKEQIESEANATRGINVITLAGDNKGASMEMGYSSTSSSQKDKPTIHIHRAYKKKPIPTVREEDAKPEEEEEEEDQQPPGRTCVNNNAQGINNSIVCNGSISGGNPGVYMFLAHESKRAAAHIGNDMRKLDDSNPAIRRRCLRSLFMESDDDSDPEKPRRHGCRACDQRYERTI